MRSKFSIILTLLLMLSVQIGFAQQRTVSGLVSDASGMPIPGVSVLVKGTNRGTETNFDGKYSISASAKDVLVFSFVGMEKKEVAATTTTLNVSLKDEAKQLSEVVVTAMNIKRDKKALGYASTTISKEQLTNTIVTTNPLESLSGKIAGVDITAPASNGASAKVIVRGFGSISSSNQPLYVIDGTPIDNSSNAAVTSSRSFDSGTGINDLDPNSIESITFLKGAAATALYGARAGRGAIIINTKKGKNTSKINVDFGTTVEVSEVARVPHFQTQFGQGWNGKGYSQLSTGQGPSNENGSWGPAFNGEVRPWGSVYNNSQLIKPYVALEDNFKDFFDLGFMTTNSIGISGGGDTSDFAIGFSNTDSDGIIPTSSDRFVRRAFTFNGGAKNEKAAIRASLNYTNKDQSVVNTGQGDEAGEGSTLMQDMLQIPTDISIVDLKDYTNNPFNTPSYYFTPYAGNPYWTLNENATKIYGHNIYGNVNMSYQFTKNFSVSWQIGGNYRKEGLKSYGAEVKYEAGSPQALANTKTVLGGVTEASTQRSQVDTYLNLNYDLELTEDFKLNLLGGFNYYNREFNQLQSVIRGFIVPNFYELSNTPNPVVSTQNNSKSRNLGIYGQTELSYIERFFLTLTLRRDQSSTLPANLNKYSYPSASLSGIVLNDNSKYLKLRVAMAKVGNSTDPYNTNASFVNGTLGANYATLISPIGGVGFFETSGLVANPDLKPEMTTEFEVGAEGNFFKKRLTFDASYYNRETKDLIVGKNLAPSTGRNLKYVNLGDVVNKGVELTLGVTPIKYNNFQWDINYTFTKNLNEVTKVNGGGRVDIISAYNITMSAVEGKPITSFFGMVPLKNDKGQYVVDPGTGYYLTDKEQQYLGDGQRDFVMGLQNTLRYKNVSLSFAFDWKQGGVSYSYTKRLSNFTGNGIETIYNDRNPFIIPNSVVAVNNPDGSVTYNENTTPITFEKVTDYFNASTNPGIEYTHLIDKTFIRLRDINLYYSFPKKLVERLGLSKISIGAYGKNMFLWTPSGNPYVDPEMSTYGNDLASEFGEFGTTPSQRSYGGVLKLSF